MAERGRDGCTCDCLRKILVTGAADIWKCTNLQIWCMRRFYAYCFISVLLVAFCCKVRWVNCCYVHVRCDLSFKTGVVSM
jgi:hypothetical protein